MRASLSYYSYECDVVQKELSFSQELAPKVDLEMRQISLSHLKTRYYMKL